MNAVAMEPAADPLHNPPDLAEHLQELLAQVPPGRVTTFGRLASALGDVAAARWVAAWLWNDPRAAGLPAHRVLLRDGRMGGSEPDEVSRRSKLLESEGVRVIGGRIDLERFLSPEMKTSRPLELLKQSQELLASRVSLVPRDERPAQVAGVDLSYTGVSDAVAAYAVVEVTTGQLDWSTTVRCRVSFPYITGYLSFREIPLHLQALAAAKSEGRLADVLLVDGSGILHPRRAGVASHLGVVAGICTIGVTKRLLFGRVDSRKMATGESRPVRVGGQVHGWAIQPRAGSKPLYVSPGHLCDAAFARDVVQRVLCNRKLPEPIWWADSLSRRQAKQIHPAAEATG